MPDRATYVTSWEAISRPHISVPAITFGHLTHAVSANTVFEARVGRFTYQGDEEPSTGDWSKQSRIDRLTSVASGAPPVLTRLTLIRTTGNATMTHHQSGPFGAGHLWKIGVQLERGEHRSPAVIPTGVRFVDSGGAVPFQMISSAPSNTGGVFLTSGLFVTDAITVGGRVTIDAGVRFDHSGATSQDLHAVNDQWQRPTDVIPGEGRSTPGISCRPAWGWSSSSMPRAGRCSARAAGDTAGRAHRRDRIVLPRRDVHDDGDVQSRDRRYPRVSRVSIPRRTCSSIPEFGRRTRTSIRSASIVRWAAASSSRSSYIGKHGRDFIGWIDANGTYDAAGQGSLPDGRPIKAWVLTSPTVPSERVFQMTNPPGLRAELQRPDRDGRETAFARLAGVRLLYVVASHRAARVERRDRRRRAGQHGGAASGAPGHHVRTRPERFHQCARPAPERSPAHLQGDGSMNVPRTGLVIAANLQYFTGKPWAATTQVEPVTSGTGRREGVPGTARHAAAVVANAAGSAACHGRSPPAVSAASIFCWTCSTR